MLKELLRDTFAYIQPGAAVDGLSDADAVRRLPGAPHSVAEIVAHIAFWQDWFLARCAGENQAMVARAADGWPDVTTSSWPEIRSKFKAGLDAAVALSEDPARLDVRLTPPIEFPPLAEYTVREALTHIATHNAHHLGQVVTLRQLSGAWPPPAGSWTW